MSEIINLMVLIDTDHVKKDFKNPSKDQNNPTGIGHNYSYMVVSDNKAISGAGTGDLNFSAEVGDRIRIYGDSEYDNFEQSILIYKIDKYSGKNVFDTFNSSTYTKMTPEPSGANVLPPTNVNRDYWFYEANVINTGTEGYRIWFALYVKAELYGYFYWDPTITVNS